MKILAFAGMPFSGKSEAVKIAKELKIPVVRMGDMVWEETKKQGLEINDSNVGKIANNMRKEHGMDIWAKRTLEHIRKLEKTELLVIDGVRNIQEIKTFEKELGNNFVLVAIDVSDEIRHKRAMSRGREDDSKDLQLIKERDKREKSWGLDKLIKSADIIIKNEGSLENLQKNIKDIFGKR